MSGSISSSWGKTVAPIVAGLAQEFAGRALIAKLDVDLNQRTAARYGVMSIPTLIFFKDGKEYARLVGALPKDKLIKKIDEIYERMPVI